jgi:3-oxoadipate enol-lactonase
MNTTEELRGTRERSSELVASQGERIYAEVTGGGSPVVLCHGLGGNHAVWWRQVGPFATGHRLVTWDQRGFGNSTSTTGAVGIEEAAGDLLAVLDATGIDRCHLVGQSMGGFVALRCALDHPDRVASLVLSTTLAAADAVHTHRLNGVTAPRRLRDRHPVLSEAFAAGWPDLAILYNQISSFGTKPSVPQMLDSMARATFTDDELAASRFPVLVLAAGADPFCPDTVMATAAARFPDAVMAVIPDGTHSAYYETPDEWNSRVLAFVDAIDAGESGT